MNYRPLMTVVLIGLFWSWNFTTDAQTYSIVWQTLDGGGSSAMGGNFILNGSVGQHDAGEVGTGGSFSLRGGFWVGASCIGNRQCADGGTLIEGVGEINDFNATCRSDDIRWAAHGATFAFSITDPVVQFELTTTAPAGFSCNSIGVDIEASKQSNNANLSLRVQLFNHASNSYVPLPGIMNLTTTDQVKSFELPGGSNAADFIRPGTDEVVLLIQTTQVSGLPNVRTQLDEIVFRFE